ncbi:glycoside hydrolase [Flavobacteriales bacterium 34_180_T64]|nr:glycoside hydrolase [Flavobacteriales bacterium 34_180_T64]
MKKIALILLLSISLVNCKSSKSTKSVKKPRTTKTTIHSPKKVNSKTNNIIDYALQFEGVKYRYGGTTKKGMDCSGLVITAFKSEAINLPRTTRDQVLSGNWIDLHDVQKGDLLFFATKKNSRSVNHVGIVTVSRSGYVEFIHSTTSKGVIVSNLAERYWYLAFVQARRIL